MKTKWYLAVTATLSLMLPHETKAGGACVSARFHDWNDMGCNQNFAGAGGLASGKSGAGGNQSSCNGDCGMPRWWVAEPYISLCLSDKPLSYTMSSGQEMAFRFYYCQRAQLPGSGEIAPSTPNVYPYEQYSYPGAALGYNCGKNASWGNNWTMSVQVWDSTWDGKWLGNGGVQYQSDIGYAPYTFYASYYAPYTQGYQALVWRPEGGMNYYNVASGSSSATDPQSQIKIQPVSTNVYPTLETGNLSTQVISNPPAADANGIFWGDAGIGVKLVYPDGSQDIFGLSAYPAIITPSGNNSPGTSATRLLLTQRLDPQGRATRIGYEHKIINGVTNGTSSFYRVRYVVDMDGRTNVFLYVGTNSISGGFQVKEIDDPYARKTLLTYSTTTDQSVSSIVDAAGLSNSVAYLADTSGRISFLTTPYGSTGFTYYDLPDSAPIAPNCYIQRAIFINENQAQPIFTQQAGSQQLYCYIHNNSNVTGTDTAHTVSGQSFDDGTSGSTPHYALTYRNTYHWGRREFTALSDYVQENLYECVAYPSQVSSWFPAAISSLTAADFNKARMRHWLMSGDDDLSITEALSSERDPSPDAGGNTPGLRTWYNYAGKPSAELLGSNPQASSVARLLPDGTSQYTTYNYYPINAAAGAGLISNNITTYSMPGGTVGTLTNSFYYATNNVDLVCVNNSAGQSVNYGYNGRHQITSITNALNQATTLTWDSSTFNLTGVQLPAGKSYTLSYYAAATPPTSTSSLLQQISISPDGRTFTISDYSAGLPSSITDDRGLTVANTWDGLNRLTSTVFPDGTSVSNVFSRLDLVGSKDRLNNWTYYGFDNLEHLVAVTNANNAVTSYNWCGCGSLTTITDALNNATSLNYDNQGNLTSIVYPDSSSLTYQFDLAGRMTNAFDGSGRNVQLAYNVQGLPVSVTGAGGTLQQRIFDALNRPISVTDANGITVTNQYDAINELTKRTWPDGISESYGYSAAGLIAYTNRNQKVTLYGRDGAGRLTAVTNANTEVTQFGYDSLNHLTSLIDGLLHQTTWQYNEYGWLTNKTDGLNRNIERFALNANGWITNRWTPEKGNTGYSYDNVGNLKSIAYPQQTITYAYDVLNRLTNMVDAVGNHSFGWTANSQLASESDAWTKVSYSYVQGLRTAMSLGTNWTQTYGYDASWRLTNTTSPAGVFAYQFLTPNFWLPASISLPNGAKIVNTFDALAMLQETDLNDHWGHTLDGYGYQRDALGLVTNLTRNFGLGNNSVSVGYDNIAQITSWNASETSGTARLNEQLGYAYDAAHNLHTRNNGGLTQTFTANAANELTNVARAGAYTLTGATPAPATGISVNGQPAQRYGDLTFACTNLTLANGTNVFTVIATNVYGVVTTNTVTVNLPQNVTLGFDGNSSLTNDGALLCGYDSENQLTNITAPGSWKSEFVFDGLNRRRIERDFFWNGSAWTKTNEVRFIYDGYLPVQEGDSNNVAKVTYTRGLDFSGSLQRAGGVGGLLARSDTSGTVFYHADAVGNVTALMDGSENIVGRYLYGPSGNILAMSGPMAFANVMRSFSEPAHPLSGILHLPFRDLNTRLPMFLTSDPIGEAGGIPLHGFVHNNFVNHFDPFGLADSDDDDLTDRMLKRLDQGHYSQGANRWTPEETQKAAEEAKHVGKEAAMIAATAATGGVGELAELGEAANAAKLARNANKCKAIAEAGNTAKNLAVIGPRATYRQFAKDIGAKFLDVTDDAWTWAKNEEYLAGVVERGDDVVFAGKFNPAQLDPNSVLAREVNYLVQHGYKWSSDFSKLTK